MSGWRDIPFADLLVESRDGEWGEGQETTGHQLCEIIRGTDFADLNAPGTLLPQRWIPDHLVARKRLLPGDVLIETAGGTARQSTGRTAYVSNTFFENRIGLPLLCSSFARHLRIDHRTYDPRFVYYLLQALYTSGYMAVFNLQHTGVSRFQFTSFKNKTHLRVPDRPTQQKVAAILSAYDDLIANNQRRIALLESMAEEIYREWFVRMRFPGAGAHLGEDRLPRRWERLAIGKAIVMIKRGITPTYSASSSQLVINQKCIRGGRVSLDEARPHDTDVAEEKHIRFGDVLINSTGVGTLGRVAMFDLEDMTVCCDTHVTICRPNPAVARTMYFGSTLVGLQEYFASMATGSTGQAELGRDVIARTQIPIPTLDLQNRFEAMIAPMVRQRRYLTRQSECLRASRDRLLPRLISGKLRVDHLDIQMPRAMREEVASEPA